MTSDYKTGRRMSYLDDSDEFNENSSEDENKSDKTPEVQEEIYGWDLFRHFPPKVRSGSNADMSFYENALQILKLVTYLLLFVLVLCGGVFSKVAILLATSQVEQRDPVKYCDYSEPQQRAFSTNKIAVMSEDGRISWYWCIVLSFIIPEIITLLDTIHYLLFKKKKFPKLPDILFTSVMESCHAGAMALLFLVVIPELDALLAVAVTSCICFVPAVLGLFSRSRIQGASGHYYVLMIIGDVIAVIAQASGIFLLPLMKNIDNTVRWLIPGVLILASCRWWPNYVSHMSRLGIIRFLSAVRERLDSARGIVQGITALCRITVFLVTSIVIIYAKGIEIDRYFNNFPGTAKYNVTLRQVNRIFTDTPDYLDVKSTDETVRYLQVNSYLPLIIVLIHAISSFIAYSSGKSASQTLMQHFGFAFPISLTVPVTIITIYVLSIFREDDNCVFHGFLPDYLFFSPLNVDSIANVFLHWEQWLWIPWLLSQAWITIHIWTPHCERLATADRLFAVSSYDSLIIDQSLMLNRRKDDALESNPEADGKRKYSQRFSETSSAAIKATDRITKIYACATMWHESEDEMMKTISSIIRLDLYRAAMRFIQNRYKVKIDDYFELETHIYFDDAFKCLYGCDEPCGHDENETQVNSYVKTFIKAMETSVKRLHILATPPMKYPAPYGGRLEWLLPGKTRLIAHLKDKNKIRHRKRWSQVMYMYYLLGYQLMNRPINIDRKVTQAENTFILTLDGDIDFRPSAVIVLLHLMKRDRELGAACGRIHPIGSGPMVWYQKFEYAIGHWLQKSTEHIIGSVLCSPGCFSLFRAKTLMEDNVMRKYATRSTEARHYVQYDQGEDRWLCTLILQSGGKVEYCAASDSYTHAPETFNEFYNQRRRWIPSTMANILDLLSTSKETRQENENISWLYIAYQWILMGSTVLGPGTIFLMMVGAFVAAFRIDNWSSFAYNLIPIAIFVVICFTSPSKIQLFVAATISALYGLVMVVVLVGIMIQITEDGWVAPSTILFFVVASQLIVAGLLHPQEWLCLICGLIYYITVPSMYMLLIIFSLFNLNNVTWGTRESKPTINSNSNQNPVEATPNDDAIDKKSKGKGSIDFSIAGLFRCMCCTHDEVSPTEKRLDTITETLSRIGSRLDSLENKDRNSSQIFMKNEEPREKMGEFKDEKDRSSVILSDCQSESEEEEEEINNDKSENFLVSPHWIRDKDLSKGGVEFLTHEEEEFWKRLISKYLYPLEEDKEQLAETAADLRSLRDEYLFKFFMINGLFVLIVFLMQLNKDTLHFEWPLGKTYNISFVQEAVPTVYLGKSYLELEPIGCLFIIGFMGILFIQFVAMLVHRFETFSHVLANTKLEFLHCYKSKDVPAQVSLDSHIKDIVDALQKVAEDNAQPVLPKKTSTIAQPSKRHTVHALISNDKRTKMPADFDTVFRQNLKEPSANPRLTSIGLSQRVIKAFEHRRTTLVAAQQRKSQFKRNNSDNIYQDAENGGEKSQYNQPPLRTSHSYDNPAFIVEEEEERTQQRL